MMLDDESEAESLKGRKFIGKRNDAMTPRVQIKDNTSDKTDINAKMRGRMWHRRSMQLEMCSGR